MPQVEDAALPWVGWGGVGELRGVADVGDTKQGRSQGSGFFVETHFQEGALDEAILLLSGSEC